MAHKKIKSNASKTIVCWFSKIVLGLIYILGITGDLNAADREFYWFVENVPCEGYTVTVRSNCMDEPEFTTNGFCPEQEVLIKSPSGKQTKTRLNLRQYRTEMLQAYSFLCHQGNNNHMYLLIAFSNGGNCNVCESQQILGIDGKWVTRGGKEFVVKAKLLGLPLSPWDNDKDITDLVNKKRE